MLPQIVEGEGGAVVQHGPCSVQLLSYIGEYIVDSITSSDLDFFALQHLEYRHSESQAELRVDARFASSRVPDFRRVGLHWTLRGGKRSDVLTTYWC